MLSRHRVVRDGLIVGIIGYASVALFYAVFDLVAARGALYTVDLLGKSVFKGLRDPGVLGVPMKLDMAAIASYNGLHFFVSLVIGLVVAGLVAQAEREPAQTRLIRFIIVLGFVVTIVAVGWLTGPIRLLLPWWSIVAANAFAVIVAGAYLLRRRPGTWRRLGPNAG